MTSQHQFQILHVYEGHRIPRIRLPKTQHCTLAATLPSVLYHRPNNLDMLLGRMEGFVGCVERNQFETDITSCWIGAAAMIALERGLSAPVLCNNKILRLWSDRRIDNDDVAFPKLRQHGFSADAERKRVVR